MFDGFDHRTLTTDRGSIFARVGGSGPALLLLHGYPQNHLMWHAVAEPLADRFTVVAADLPGYGDSFRPPPSSDHLPHSKRVIANDLVQAMEALGHERFAVAGHDRGGRVAYRMALDHPDRITAAAAFDVVPTGEVWGRADAALTLAYWHWGFLAQPEPLPERMIGADPGAFFDFHVRRLGLGVRADRYPDVLMDAYRRLLDDPSVVQAICEDYRAGATVDREHDDADRCRRLIECPLLALWSAGGALPRFYGDVLEVWRPWARDVSGWGVDGGHFLVEDQPEEIVDGLSALVGRVPDSLASQHQWERRTDMSLDSPTQPDTASRPTDALAATLKRTEVQHQSSSIPGRDIVQVLTEIPEGVASGWHLHPGEEVGYIIAGTVQMEIKDRPTLVLNAGDGFLIPPRTPHNALDLGPGTGMMLSTYLVETGEPISSVADSAAAPPGP